MGCCGPTKLIAKSNEGDTLNIEHNMLRARMPRTVDYRLKDFSGVKRHSPGNHQDQRFIL
jgi:hypothetical protein